MEVRIDGTALPPIRSRKLLWLLALLTLRHGRQVERPWLATLLWPDLDESQALANLRPVLSDLRTALGSQAYRILMPNRGTLRLDLDGAEVDVLAFDFAVESNRRDTIERAVPLYRAPLLEGCSEDWVFQERDARQLSLLNALEMLAEAARQSGDLGASAKWLRRVIAVDPLSDTAHRRLMDALADLGDRNAALNLYREFRERLHRELGAVPHEETTALYRKLRQEAREGVKAPPVEPLLPQPLPKVTGNLAHALTELIGREDERTDVLALLQRARLVTLTGPGGIGKTRLALAVAEESERIFPDGAWYVPLESLPASDDADEDGQRQIFQQIADQLGIVWNSGLAIKPMVTQHLRTKRLLILLDNCEHVLAACAQTTRQILRDSLGVRVLATSREPLGLNGETTWRVPGLATPSPEQLPDRPATLVKVLPQYEGIQLFRERATAVHQSFALTRENARDIAMLCFRLNGLPLALELAAARVSVHSPAQILAQIDARPLDALESRYHDTAPRHRSLRATLAWSHNLLPPSAQTFLADLSVFRGGWTLEAARAVSPDVDAAAMLETLRDASLIGLSSGGDVRFSMLETVRQFASELLEQSGQGAAVRRRHAIYFESWVKDTGRKFQNSLELYTQEYANLSAALSGALETGEDDLLVFLCQWMSAFWVHTGRIQDGNAWQETIMRRLSQEIERAGENEVPDIKRRNLLLAKARHLEFTENSEAGAECWLQLSDVYGLAGDASTSRTTLFNAAVSFGWSDLRRSYEILENSLSLERSASVDGRGNPVILAQIASVAHKLGRVEEAQHYLKEALALSSERGESDIVGAMRASRVAGQIAQADGNLPLAQDYYEETIARARQLGDRLVETTTLVCLAGVVRESGDHDRSESLLSEAETAKGPSPFTSADHFFQHERAESLLARGAAADVAPLVRKSLRALRGKARSRRMLVHFLLLLVAEADFIVAGGDVRRIARILGAALAIASRLGLAEPERDERERIARLRAGLTEQLGAEQLAQEERIGAAFEDAAAVEFALTIG